MKPCPICEKEICGHMPEHKWAFCKAILMRLVDRMKKRAEGRDRLREAAWKRHRRAQARAIENEGTVTRNYVGCVDDAEYGAKPPQMSLLEAKVKL